MLTSFLKRSAKPAAVEEDTVTRMSSKLDALLAIVSNPHETSVRIWDRTLEPRVFADPRVLEQIKIMLMASGTRLDVYTTPEIFKTYTQDHPRHPFVNFLLADDYAALHAVDSLYTDMDIIVGSKGMVFLEHDEKGRIITAYPPAAANLNRIMDEISGKTSAAPVAVAGIAAPASP